MAIEEVETERKLWRARRMMAWLALVATIAAMGGMMFWVEIGRIAVLDTIIETFFWVMASVIGAYMGFTAWTHVRTTNRNVTLSDVESKTTTVKEGEK